MSPQPPNRRDRSVYQHQAKAKPRTGESRIVSGGKSYRYLNSAIPTTREGQPIAPLESACCAEKGRCGHAYSHLMKSGQTVCEECRVQDMAELAAELQAAGIELGWHSSAKFKQGVVSHSEAYQSSLHIKRRRVAGNK